jgi:site-specific recombinase XerD
MAAEEGGTELVPVGRGSLATRRGEELPALVTRAGGPAAQAWTDFFDGKVRNDHTRRAYQRAVQHFLAWCEGEGLELPRIMAGDIGRYLSRLPGGPAKKKGTLAALRRYFRLLVERHICLINPAAEAEAPRYEMVEGKTPEITDAQFRALLAAIDSSTMTGLRDQLIIKTLAYTGARVGAVAALKRHDYYEACDQWMLHFDEKRGKSREIPVAHDLKVLFDEYLERSGIKKERRRRDEETGEWEPIHLFRTAAGRTGELTKTAMTGNDIYKMMRRHAKRAGIGSKVSPHSFRVAIATDLYDQGVPDDEIQTLLGHSDVRTTNLYKRNKRGVTRNLVERIRLGR